MGMGETKGIPSFIAGCHFRFLFLGATVSTVQVLVLRLGRVVDGRGPPFHSRFLKKKAMYGPGWGPFLLPVFFLLNPRGG